MASTTSSSENPIETVTLRTTDEQLVEVEKSVAMEFVTVKQFFDDDPAAPNITFPLCDVSKEILDKIVAYYKKHLEFRANSTPIEELKSFDLGFVQGESTETLLKMIVAANYLEANDLLNFLEDVLAEKIKGKGVKHVRKLLEIENDFTPEEEAALLEEHAWAFKGVDEDD